MILTIEQIDIGLNALSEFKKAYEIDGAVERLRAIESIRPTLELLMPTALEMAKGNVWQPIETAPKDGTQIIVGCSKYKRSYVAIFERGTWRSGWEGGDWTFDVELKPTHWMPLPTPPKESE